MQKQPTLLKTLKPSMVKVSILPQTSIKRPTPTTLQGFWPFGLHEIPQRMRQIVPPVHHWSQTFDCFILLFLKRLPQKRYRWFLGLLSLGLMMPAQALDLRVAIKQGVNRVGVGGSTTAIVRDETGRQLGQLPRGGALMAQSQGNRVRLGNWQGRQLWVEPSGQGYIWIGDRWYRGDVRLVSQGNTLSAINYVDLEEYLYSVVGAEMIASWPLEALKAQAVAARSYALYKRAESPNDLSDVDTTTATQVYKGLETETRSTMQAVRETAAEVMVYNGQVILAVYHSSSGGHTENVEDIWSSPLPYLRGVVDYDQNAPVYQWSQFFSAGELSRRVGGVGTIQTLIPERTTPQGRVISMTAIGDRGRRQVSGAQLQQALGLRSRLFVVTATGNGFQVSGRGFGHGVGLSQWGAKELAQQGFNYRQILAHYYPNAALSRLGGGN